MFTFNHVTERTFSLVDAAKLGLAKKGDDGKYRLVTDRLPANSKSAFREKNGTSVVVVHLIESLTCPQTAEELAGIAQSETSTVEMEAGDGKVEMTQACADYLRGRKLRSNQERGAELVGDGKSVTRQATLAWFLQKPENVAVYAAKLTSAKPKDINAWLDGLYADNAEAVDQYAGK